MKHTTVGTYGIIAVAAVIVGVVVVSRSAAVEAVYPMERSSLFFRRAVWPRVKGVFTGPSSAAEAARLKREVKTLLMMQGELERLDRENASLRRALGYVAREPEKWIAAPVLVDHGGAVDPRRVLRAGRGSVDGVAVDSVVVSPDGLVGIVDEVTPHTSKIVLITDPSVKVSCVVALPGGSNASGILEGGDANGLSLTHLRGLADKAPMARVVSSGRGGVFPRGFEVGTLVEAGIAESGEWFGRVRPSVDFEELEDVFIRRER